MAKILLVDDDNALRQLYAVELGKKHTVMEASDGQQGLSQVRAQKPDLILLDIMMPNLDGVATLTKLKEDPETSKIPVVMLTNFGQENLVQQAFSAGATDYLLKYKVTPAEVSEKVDQVLATKPA